MVTMCCDQRSILTIRPPPPRALKLKHRINDIDRRREREREEGNWSDRKSYEKGIPREEYVKRYVEGRRGRNCRRRERTKIGEKGIRMDKSAARRERNFRDKERNNGKKASKEKF